MANYWGEDLWKRKIWGIDIYIRRTVYKKKWNIKLVLYNKRLNTERTIVRISGKGKIKITFLGHIGNDW